MSIMAPGSFADPTGAVVPPGPSAVPQSLQLPRNPTLPQHPLGAYTDAQYEAAVAQLRAQTQQQYNDVLQQLGYTDPNGNFVMGSAETNANRQRSDAQYQEDLARQKVTQEMQQNGTLFSGWRGTREGQDTMPFEQTKAQIGIDLPNTLSQLYEKANGIVQDFMLQHNQLLADAAGRATQAAINAPGGAGTGDTSLTTPPPADPSAPPSDPSGGTPDPTLIHPPPTSAPSAAPTVNPIGAGTTDLTDAVPTPGITGYGSPHPLVQGSVTGSVAAPGSISEPTDPTTIHLPLAADGTTPKIPTVPAPTTAPPVPSYDPAAIAAAAASQARRPGMQQ